MLVKKLEAETVDRHYKIIEEYSQEKRNESPNNITLVGNGVEKGVYRVDWRDESIIAAAAAIDPGASLLKEYFILSELYDMSPNFFPKPYSHSASRNGLGEMIAMELLKHIDLKQFRIKNDIKVDDLHRKLSYLIGRSIGEVTQKTGRYSSEPHDGNILAKLNKNNEIEIKFCDASQFLEGTIEDACQSILTFKEDRPECFRFINKFRKGLCESLVNIENISYNKAWEITDFLREYNDIF